MENDISFRTVMLGILSTAFAVVSPIIALVPYCALITSAFQRKNKLEIVMSFTIGAFIMVMLIILFITILTDYTAI